MDTPRDVKTVLLSGGGTGGHITPILAVAQELKRKNTGIRTVYVGERGGKFKELTETHQAIDQTFTIWAGKFRRYNGESWLKRLLDVKTNLLNLRDLFYFAIGTVQSWFLVGRVKPDMIFLKGGFVGVPVGLAAAARHKPFVTHDSDALPGLANRIVSRWAKIHAVALDPSIYDYPRSKTIQVGVLVESHFQFVTPDIQQKMKIELGIPPQATVLLITGGSSGAANINQAVLQIAPKLLIDYPDLHIIHQVGKGKSGIYRDYTHKRLVVLEFMRPMYIYTGAADIVVSRASGNTIAELGVQGKAVIAVPNPLLTGGHQLKNAQALADSQSAIIVPETDNGTDISRLDMAIRGLLDDPTKRDQLANRLHSVTLTDAAAKLVNLLLQNDKHEDL